MNLALMRQEILRLAEHLLVPARPYVEGMEQRDWKTFALNLQGSARECCKRCECW
jgi:hypothetical protein